MKTIKEFIGLFVMSVMVFSFVGVTAHEGNAPRQTEVSDSELEVYANIMTDLQTEQKEAQEKMREAIEENPDMDMQRYQEISQARTQGGDADMSTEEEEAFSAIQKVIEEEQQKLDKKMESLLEEHGME
ncbi:MAG: hypothetical protein ACOC90_08470, partial [Bacteroidota bacterium]